MKTKLREMVNTLTITFNSVENKDSRLETCHLLAYLYNSSSGYVCSLKFNIQFPFLKVLLPRLCALMLTKNSCTKLCLKNDQKIFILKNPALHNIKSRSAAGRISGQPFSESTGNTFKHSLNSTER